MHKILLFCSVTLLLGVGRAAGAGISTHFEAADQSIPMLDAGAYPDLAAILRWYAPVYRVGAIYPDWGYLSDDFRRAAEAAHWPPFHRTALEYYVETYGTSANEHSVMLFAFLAGLSCHGSMDDVWHFGSTSFLRQSRQRDGAEEGLIEPGVDFMVQIEQRPGPENMNWWIPVADLVAISERAGYSEVTPASVMVGMGIMQVGALLEDAFSWLLYFPSVVILPWSHENYMTWYDGGVLNGATVTATVLQSYWDELRILQSGGEPPRRRAAFGVHDHQDFERANSTEAVALGLLARGDVQLNLHSVGSGACVFGGPHIHDFWAFVRAVFLVQAR